MARILFCPIWQLPRALVGLGIWVAGGALLWLSYPMSQATEPLSSLPVASPKLPSSPPLTEQDSDSSSSQGQHLAEPMVRSGSLGPAAPSGPTGIALEPADQLYQFALGLYAQEDWTLAAREFQRFLREYPQHPYTQRVHFLLGEALLQLGQYEEALVRFREYLRQQPKGQWAAKALFRSGEAAFLAGQPHQAAPLLKEFLARYPTDPLGAYALWYLGQVAEKEAQWSAASEWFRQSLERFPQSPIQAQCRLDLAEALEALGKAEEALRLYQTVVQQDVGHVGAEGQFRLAALLYNLQRYEEAARAFQLYERRFPKRPQVAYARLYRGFALFRLKEWEEAEECFAWLARLERQATSSSPGSLRPPAPSGSPAGPVGSGGPGSRSGNFLGWPGLPPNQQEHLRRQGQYWLGMVQRERGQWVESAKTFSQLAQSAAELAERIECHFYAADSWLRAENPEAALKEFDLALGAMGSQRKVGAPGLSPISPAAPESSRAEGLSVKPAAQWLDKILRGKVEAAALLHQHCLVDRTAEEFFQRCAESPLGAEVVGWQAQSLLQRGQWAQAIRLLEPWVRKLPAGAGAWRLRYLLAYAYQASGRWAEAEAQLAGLLEGESGPWKPLAQRAQASIRIAQKQYQEALPLLEAYLASGPAEPDRSLAQAQLGVCYAWLGQSEQAQAIYEQLAQSYSSAEWFGGFVEQLAEAALETGNFPWAKSLFEQLTTWREPTLAQRALLGLGWTQYRAGQFQEAAASLGRLLAMEQLPPPVAAEAAFLRASLLSKLHQPEEALRLWERILNQYPDSKWFGAALLASGRLHAQLGHPNEAAERFQRYVETFPKAADLDAALYDWAWSLKELGQQEEALQLFKRIHREFPKSPYWAEVTLRLAHQAYQAQEYAEAEQWVSEVLEVADSQLRPYALYLRMQIAAAQAQWESVGRLADQLLQEYPGNPFQVYAEFWQVELAFRKKDFRGAEMLMEKFIRKYPSSPAGLAPLVALRQAQLLAHQHRWEEVIRAASQIQKEYPQFEQMYEVDYLLGRALAMKARFDEAREAFYRVIRSPHGANSETAAMAQWYIGETYFHQRDYQTALRAYRLVEILYAYPEWQALALLEAARCYEKLGQPEQAQKLYHRLLSEFPQTAASQQYLRGQNSGPAGSEPSSAEPTAAPPEDPSPLPSAPSEQDRSQLLPDRWWERIAPAQLRIDERGFLFQGRGRKNCWGKPTAPKNLPVTVSANQRSSRWNGEEISWAGLAAQAEVSKSLAGKLSRTCHGGSSPGPNGCIGPFGLWLAPAVSFST